MSDLIVNLAPVRTFMIAAGQVRSASALPLSPVPSAQTALKTLDFIASELAELRDALNQYIAAPNPAQLVEVSKELADVLFTAGNVAVALHLPIGEVFDAVAKSNTSKFLTCDCRDNQIVGCEACHFTGYLNPAREGFKVPKGPNYRTANEDIRKALIKARRIQA